MELRRRNQKSSEASIEDSDPYASCPSPPPGYRSNLIHRSASTGGIGNDSGLGDGVVDNRPSPHPPTRPFNRRSNTSNTYPISNGSTTSPIGPCNPTGGVTLDDSISPLPLSYVPRLIDHDQGAVGAVSEEPPSSVPPPPRRVISEGGLRGSYVHSADGIPPPTWTSSGGASLDNRRKRLLLVLHLIALSALSCAALYLRGAMTTVEVEHKRRMRDEAVAKEKGELEADIGAIQLQIKQHMSSHLELLLEQQRQYQIFEPLNTQHLELHKVITHTTNLVSDASEKREKYKAMVDGVEELGEYMKVRETELWKRIKGLENNIGRESYREALEWFGPGPHRVEFEIEYPRYPQPPSDPDPATWKKWTSYLLMEMAPLNLMPHTVNLFLKQVHHQLWDGTYVAMNKRHVMQISPRYEDEPANVTATQRSYHHFHAEGLDKVSYQEYSPEYPHEQYTIGMSGRPSGPDFYINKMDNTVIHGPGGQMSDGDMHNEADPCFGRLLNGSRPFAEILAAIDRVPLNSDQYPETKIRIKSAKILKSKNGDRWVVLKPGKKWDEEDKIMPLPEPPHGV